MIFRKGSVVRVNFTKASYSFQQIPSFVATIIYVPTDVGDEYILEVTDIDSPPRIVSLNPNCSNFVGFELLEEGG